MKSATRVTKNAPFPKTAEPLLMKIDEESFIRARDAAISESLSFSGIGTLMEKTMHKTVKLYIEPNTAFHEVAHLSHIADVENSDGIYEVQTRAYDKLKLKLSRLLPDGRVTVVCPLAYNKTVCWLDPESGELGKHNKSPKHENVYDALFHLFQIRDYVTHENLRVRIIFFSADEYRRLDGWDRSRKRGSQRIERIPTEILYDVLLSRPEDYALLLPENLPEEFIASEFQREIGRTSRFSFYVLKLLLSVGAIEECGKRGRAALYRRC